MSAYVFDRDEINRLVRAGESKGILPRHDSLSWFWGKPHHRATLLPGDDVQALRIGQMLWDENIRSVEHRYPDCVGNRDNLPGPIGETFVYGPHHIHPFSHDLSPAAIWELCESYAYQACEHPGWEPSEAFAYIRALKDACGRAMVELLQEAATNG